MKPKRSADLKGKGEFTESANKLTMIDSILALTKRKIMEPRFACSSGNKHLGVSTIQIAGLSTPFGPVLTKIARDVDVLHVTRTWHFDKKGPFDQPFNQLQLTNL